MTAGFLPTGTDRRSFLRSGIGVAGLGLFGATGATAAASSGFTHGVASGDPKQSSIVLWTRFVPVDAGMARLRVEVAEDRRFDRIVARGEADASPLNDHCVKFRSANFRRMVKADKIHTLTNR